MRMREGQTNAEQLARDLESFEIRSSKRKRLHQKHDANHMAFNKSVRAYREISEGGPRDGLGLPISCWMKDTAENRKLFRAKHRGADVKPLSILIFLPRILCRRVVGPWWPGIDATSCSVGPAAWITSGPVRSCGFGALHECAPRGLAVARKANGARTTAKSKALRMKLRAFMTGSLEYTQQQNDFAIIS
jgi:hypothetical protein